MELFLYCSSLWRTRLWGTVNWLVCERCKAPFQCVDLASCAFHPQSAVAVSSSGAKLPTPQYLCCGQPVARFPTLPHWQVSYNPLTPFYFILVTELYFVMYLETYLGPYRELMGLYNG